MSCEGYSSLELGVEPMQTEGGASAGSTPLMMEEGPDIAMDNSPRHKLMFAQLHQAGNIRALQETATRDHHGTQQLNSGKMHIETTDMNCRAMSHSLWNHYLEPPTPI